MIFDKKEKEQRKSLSIIKPDIDKIENPPTEKENKSGTVEKRASASAPPSPAPKIKDISLQEGFIAPILRNSMDLIFGKLGKPLISDKEYDKLKPLCDKLEAKYLPDFLQRFSIEIQFGVMLFVIIEDRANMTGLLVSKPAKNPQNTAKNPQETAKAGTSPHNRFPTINEI